MPDTEPGDVSGDGEQATLEEAQELGEEGEGWEEGEEEAEKETDPPVEINKPVPTAAKSKAKKTTPEKPEKEMTVLKRSAAKTPSSKVNPTNKSAAPKATLSSAAAKKQKKQDDAKALAQAEAKAKAVSAAKAKALSNKKGKAYVNQQSTGGTPEEHEEHEEDEEDEEDEDDEGEAGDGEKTREALQRGTTVEIEDAERKRKAYKARKERFYRTFKSGALIHTISNNVVLTDCSILALKTCHSSKLGRPPRSKDTRRNQRQVPQKAKLSPVQLTHCDMQFLNIKQLSCLVL